MVAKRAEVCYNREVKDSKKLITERLKIRSMNRNIIFIVLGAVLLGLGIFAGLRLLSNRNQGPANLKITSNPATTVFLDTQHLGKTPYEGEVKAGEYTLKLIPEGPAAPSWQTKINLAPGVLTFVNHDFGDQELTSAGEILTLEKISGKNAEVAVLSTPDGAQVTLDGTLRGATPLVLPNIEAGDHEVSVAAPGFLTRGVKVKATPGFKLVASFQLALSTTASPSATPSPSGSPTASPKTSPKPSGTPGTALPKPYVKILDTPTGFLRVRMEPSTSATEAAKVNPGETFPLVDEQSGWYKIKYSGANTGWIAGQYAEKFE